MAAIGDRGPLHVDEEFARLTRFRRRIVHGFLPVTCLFFQAAEEGLFTGQGLRHFACRFLRPVLPGAALEFSLEGESQDRRAYRFRIFDAKSGAEVTTGVMKLAPRRGEPRGSVPAVLIDEREGNSFSLSELKPGQTETVPFRPGAALALMAQALGSTHWPDGNAISVPFVSAMVGMRLPGSYGTCVDLEVDFEADLEPAQDTSLVGTIDRVSSSSARARLALEWRQEGRTFAQGAAHIVINAPAPTEIGCAAIREQHLAWGLAGKVALVTGASRGIGAATAKLLAMAGALVAVHYFRGAKAAAAIVEDITAHKGTAIAVEADLASGQAVAAMVAKIEAALGEIDILVNNAVAEFSPKALDELGADDYLAELNVSLFGMHACCKAVLPAMRRKHAGKIITLGALAAASPMPGQNQYFTAKGAVAGYTRSLAAETAADNIQVSLVVPRLTQTSLLAALAPSHLAKLAEESPSGELLQPIDVAKAILYLASDWAAPISGQTLVLGLSEPSFT